MVSPSADDPFQVHFEDLFKQQPAIAFDVIQIKHSRALAPDKPLQHRLSFNQRKRAQVLAVQVQQVKRDEDTLPLSENQISKGRSAGFIEAGNLAVENGAFDAKMFGNPSSQLRESPEHISVSRDEFALTGLDVGESAEAIHLQFVDKKVRIEWFRTAGKPHWA
jgi:hypothetical protein